MVCFDKFVIQDGEFIYIIVGGHLAEKIGRTECIAYDSLFIVQKTYIDIERDAGATDDIENGRNAGGRKAYFLQILAGKIDTSLHMNKGILGACTDIVAFLFNVSCVMEKYPYCPEGKIFL